MTIQMKATEQYFPVVLFISVCCTKVVLTFDSVDEVLKCDVTHPFVHKKCDQDTFPSAAP